ncbi:YbaB/EbfC family nucleoid-associated protein [Helicobacter muridarum]|uniref:Nucleoid-associated protein LS73_005415 n=1 Tax=Helicobacter muridarum TaxID=216 RepID=A0A099TZ81_9HELI|nr:YbaB/EbfC family nucleoid-associated protein [Helicobacter muridarum]TLE00240.1 YbaB/EbfC family nucleoid-associated protein [Helicobacter muridarum]STQ85731.1 Transcriptional regulatory protein [Helicobacter muridarum]
MFDPKDLQNLLGSMQEQVREMEEKAEKKIIQTKSGGGLIDVKFNGKGELVDINIDDELLQDKQALQLLLISALNEGYKQIEDSKKDNIMEHIKSLNLFNYK